MDRSNLAIEYFNQGYNCAQSVVLAFSDVLSESDKNAIVKVSSSFGGGIGRLREVCGAFSGACMVAGYIHGESDKASHYALIQKLAEDFKKENGSIICRELLGDTLKLSSENPSVRTEEYKKKRPCAKMCAVAVKILEKELNL